MTIALSTIRNLKNDFDLDYSDVRDVIENVVSRESDFEVNDVRFIQADEIDQIQADELLNDLYVLGCFNASFIASECNWPTELVEAAQQGEAFEALGQAIADNCDMVEFAKSYSSADGYGHHFNHYDSGCEELTIDGIDFMVFKNKA